MTPEDYEANSLALVCDVQRELADALSETGGKPSRKFLDQYLYCTCAHIYHAVDGYIHLRQSGKVEASKHLIRTVIEAMFMIKALDEEPGLLYRIVITEYAENRKWARAIPEPKQSTALADIDTKEVDFKSSYAKAHPQHSIPPKYGQPLQLREAADIAKMGGYYDSHYRLYCKFTHAAFMASTGSLDRLQTIDNTTVAMCALVAINPLKGMGASSPNSQSLWRSYDEFAKLPITNSTI